MEHKKLNKSKFITQSASHSDLLDSLQEHPINSRYQKGEKLDLYYQIHQVIEKGGIGEVYLCFDTRTGMPFAAKTFKPQYSMTLNILESFYQEVNIWIALEKHPNIVRCFALQVIDNVPFICSEWIVSDERRKTADLQCWLEDGALDTQLALDFAIDLCRGLIHAHKKQPGIVHGDLKPGNILISQDRIAKIADFGLARIISETNELNLSIVNNTKEHFLGTPYYAAPEQWRGEKVDARTDIYAIGCTLYEMLTGYKPYNVDSNNKKTKYELLRKKHEQTPPPELPSNFPKKLNEIIQICLQKRPVSRFASHEQLLHELSDLYHRLFDQSPRVHEVSEELTAIDYNDRGNTYFELYRYNDALNEYAQAIQIDSNYAIPYYNRARIYTKLRQYEKALNDYSQAINLDPNNIFSHLFYTQRATVYIELQQYKEALADIKKH